MLIMKVLMLALLFPVKKLHGQKWVWGANDSLWEFQDPTNPLFLFHRNMLSHPGVHQQVFAKWRYPGCMHQCNCPNSFWVPLLRFALFPSKIKPSFLSHAGLFIKMHKMGNVQIDGQGDFDKGASIWWCIDLGWYNINAPIDTYFVASCYKIMCTVTYYMCLHICQRKRHEERSNQT